MFPFFSFRLAGKYGDLREQAAPGQEGYVIRYANPEHRQRKKRKSAIQGVGLLTIGENVLRIEGETWDGKPLRWAPDLASFGVGWTKREWRHGYLHWFFLEDRSRRLYLTTGSLRRGPTRELYERIVREWQTRLHLAELRARAKSSAETLTRHPT